MMGPIARGNIREIEANVLNTFPVTISLYYNILVPVYTGVPFEFIASYIHLKDKYKYLK